MKKLIYLLSISFLILQSCSSGDSDNNNSTTSVSDVEGNVYQTITICNQTWTKSNLNVSKYRNGDEIPQVTNASHWANLTTGAWCYYNNDPANGAIYGKLYNWYAVKDPRGLAPLGWHIPTDAEWTSLSICLGDENVAGGAIKESGTTHWVSPNTGATNSSGFSALPGGYQNEFDSAGIGQYGIWWSSTEEYIGAANAWNYNLGYNYGYVSRQSDNKVAGFSVRCVKN